MEIIRIIEFENRLYNLFIRITMLATYAKAFVFE